MEREVRSWTLAELAALLDGELSGSEELLIDGPAEAGSGGPSHLTFATDEKFLARAEASPAGAILVPPGMVTKKPSIRVADPKAAFGRFLYICRRPLPLPIGIHATAIIDPRAQVDPSASIGAYAIVERDAFIGPECQVYPFCYVGDHCRLEGSNILFPHVVLYQDVRLGARTVVHAGTVLGADGFGYIWDGSRQVKIPQVGGVNVGPDCEIGALSAIDRAMVGDTTLGQDTKIDNLVQIAHNVTVGEHTVIAALTGIGGSSEIGDRVAMGGQVGVADHVRITDDVSIAARAATTSHITEPGVYKGFPMQKYAAEQRLIVLLGRLPEMAKTVRDLEKRIAELESREG
jgi:UDP-3-O-[3-hydroxymyristoyl] glucosamine N-acyltransferase